MAPPNLLFLFTDEQRYDTLACYGNDRIQMPHLNRLASQSCVFDRAYVTQPVCTPSRASLMTGLWPHQNGCTENNVPLSPQTPCLPEMLPAGEYATGYHGKWHLGDEIYPQHGYHEWRGIDDGYRGYYGPDRDPADRSHYHHWLIAHGRTPANGSFFGRLECCQMPEELSKPAYLADQASRFLEENAHRPFCLTVNFFEPHMPFTSCRDGQYDPADTPLPDDFDAPLEDAPLKTRLFARAYASGCFDGQDLSNEQEWRKLRARYWGLCSLVDTHAGHILDKLELLGLTDNTIVVYTSDHGDMMGSRHLAAKCVQFEPAVRVPLLIRLPGQDAQKTFTGPLSQIDVVPTLLDLMGADVPDELPGTSRAPLLAGGEDGPADDVFIEWNGPNNGFGDAIGQVRIAEPMRDLADDPEIVSAITDPVRTIITPEGWKYTRSQRGEDELYHLANDPQERVNLAGDATHADLRMRLTQRLRAWQERTGDTVPIDDPPAPPRPDGDTPGS